VPTAKRGPRTERDRRRRILSQNFLADRQAVEIFMSMLDVGPDDLVFEPGAGEGALTVALSQRCREVFAYEIDPHLLPRLREYTRGLGNVHVMEGDFLAVRPPPDRFHVVGNVPFSITSQVVDWCLRADTLASATIITQLEYARKRTGGYGRWSLLTVQTWPWFRWELRGRISPDQFRPRPRVDAGVLRLSRRDRALVRPVRAAAYSRLVEVGFSGVGGSLYRSLVRQYPREKVDTAFHTINLSHDLVVAFVSPDDWLRIFSELDR
jgi:23S rRNA (adenine-N6)-dimethyltransferase